VGQARAVPQTSDETLTKALALDYPFEEFLMYNIVEGFLYQTKQDRVDKETTKSLRPDLGVRAMGQQMCDAYLLERYSEDYDLRLKYMAGEERKQLCTELIEQLLETSCMITFCSLLSEGIKRGEITFQIVNFNSQGVLDLHSALLDQAQTVVQRAKKLYVFYTGEDSDEKPVWNGGNMFKTDTKPVRELLVSMSEEATWDKIQELYQSKGSHVYRDSAKCKCNRHGHSNSLPSYFAFGHDMLAEFVNVVSSDTWKDYQKAHPNCCGVCEAVSDLDNFKRFCEHISAHRTRRTECLNDTAKRDAAIDAKKKRKAEGGGTRKGFAGYQPGNRGNSKLVRIASAGATDPSSNGSDTDDSN